MAESTRFESEQVEMPRGFESHRLLQEGLLLVQHTALKAAGPNSLAGSNPVPSSRRGRLSEGLLTFNQDSAGSNPVHASSECSSTR